MTTNTEPTTPEPTGRDRLVTNLRKLADLLESNHDVVCHGVDVAFFPHSPGPVQAIMAAFDLPWQMDDKEGTGDVNFKARSGRGGKSDFDVTIFCRASEVCTEAGTRTVTDWQPLPEIAAFLRKDG